MTGSGMTTVGSGTTMTGSGTTMIGSGTMTTIDARLSIGVTKAIDCRCNADDSRGDQYDWQSYSIDGPT